MEARNVNCCCARRRSNAPITFPREHDIGHGPRTQHTPCGTDVLDAQARASTLVLSDLAEGSLLLMGRREAHRGRGHDAEERPGGRAQAHRSKA